MRTTWTPKRDLRVGDRTVLGVITALEFSESGKTLVITVRKDDGSLFTDRVPAAGKMAVLAGE